MDKFLPLVLKEIKYILFQLKEEKNQKPKESLNWLRGKVYIFDIFNNGF